MNRGAIRRGVPLPRGRGIGAAILGSGALALLLRVTYLATTENPFWTYLGLDTRGYHEWALSVIAGQGLGPAPFPQAPLFPLTLSLVYSLFGPTPVAGLWGQLVPGVGAVMVAAWVVGVWKGRRAAWMAGISIAAYPPAIFYTGVLLPATWAMFWSAGVLATGWRLLARPRRSVAGMCGLCGGLLTVTQPLLGIFIFPLAWMAARRGRAVLLPLLGLWLLLPVATLVYNGAAGGSWSLVSVNGGVNFYIGNGPLANGAYVPPVGLRESNDLLGIEAARARMVAQGTLEPGDSIDAGRANEYWWGAAVAEMTSHPGRTLGLYLRKLGFLFGAYEVPQLESFPFERQFSWVLQWPAWTFAWFSGLSLMALILLWKDGDARWMAASVLVGALALAAFFVTARFRLPLVPWLAVLGAAGLDTAWRVWRERDGVSLQARPVVALVAGVAAALALSIDWMGVHAEGSFGQYFYRLGVIAEREGRSEDAMARYLEAVDADSTQAKAQLNLGTLLARAGRVEEARPHLEAAVRHDPGNAMAHQNLGQLRQVSGDRDGALASYRDAIGLAPEMISAVESAAYLLWEMGKISESRQHLLSVKRQSEDMSPPDVRASRLLALIDERRILYRSHLDDGVTRNDWWESTSLLEADLLLAQGKMPEAVRAYEDTARDSTVAVYATSVASQLKEALGI